MVLRILVFTDLSVSHKEGDVFSCLVCYSGHHKATEEEGVQGILGKELWRKKCGEQDTSTAGGRWRRQHKTELDGDKWSVDYVPPGATRRKGLFPLRLRVALRGVDAKPRNATRSRNGNQP